MMRRSLASIAQARGSAAAELAVAAPVMILILFGLFELAQMFWISHTLQDAADDTARYATVTRITDQAALSAQMTSRLHATVGADAQVSVMQSTQNGIAFAEITGTMTYVPLGGLIGITAVTLTGRASVPVLGGG